MKIRSWIGLVATAAILSATPGLSAGMIIYVDDDAAPSGDGLSWQTAYRFLQDALAVSVAGDEIRVGPGEYWPDRDEANPSGASDCCVTHGGMGCDDPGCEADVCAVLPQCCVIAWDDICSVVAHTVCGNLCSDGRSATFQLISGVELQGGYAGPGAPDPDARDVGLYESILSGDLSGNDAADFVNNDENSYNVVTGS